MGSWYGDKVGQKIKQDICIGQNIRRIRKEKGIKQIELAALLQLNNVAIIWKRAKMR